MTYDEVLRIVKHPIIFKRRRLYAVRTAWYREASEKVDELERSDTTKPFRIKLLLPYITWSKEHNIPVAKLWKDGELVSTEEKDFPQELKEATDWYVVMNDPHLFRWANRDKMTPDWLRSIPDLPSSVKELLEEP